MDVNYLVEINGLDDWEFGNPLSATAYKVMRKLLMLANRQRFPERLPVSNTSLCFLVGCTEKSLIAARQQLIQRGLIDYKGKKKQTPVYTIHYFSLNPRYNRKNYSYEGGINGGYEGGIDGGITGGQDGGTSINNTYAGLEEPFEDSDDEDITNDDTPEQEEGTIDNDLLLHPFPTLPSVDVQSRPRTYSYQPRTRTLNHWEVQQYAILRTILEQAEIKQLYGQDYGTLCQLVESDAYPLELVGYAIDKTRKRDKKYPRKLFDPWGYTITLLNDWKDNKLSTVQEVQEYRDDWMHEN